MDSLAALWIQTLGSECAGTAGLRGGKFQRRENWAEKELQETL